MRACAQNSLCGPRKYMRNGDVLGDDSCPHARDGRCQDGGVDSERQTNAAGEIVSLCRFGTDKFDCPVRTLTTLGVLSHSNALPPNVPLPPPSPPKPPPSPPPNEAWMACNNLCTTDGHKVDSVGLCSDGGLGARLVGAIPKFECDYGTFLASNLYIRA